MMQGKRIHYAANADGPCIMGRGDRKITAATSNAGYGGKVKQSRAVRVRRSVIHLLHTYCKVNALPRRRATTVQSPGVAMKVQYAKYQSRGIVRLDVYETFGERGISEAIAIANQVRTDAFRVACLAKEQGYAAELDASGAMISAPFGGMIKIACRVTVTADVKDFKLDGVKIK